MEFYQQIQRSMQSADQKPPKLVQGPEKIHPAGTALVEDSTSKSPSSKKTNNRMPGNIVCGICGAVRYYAFILQAKKFGTFSCEPCRKFISKAIKMCGNTSEDDELFPCLSGSGMCVVPPVLRSTSGQIKKSEASVTRCQACWLKLCLIGFKLDADLYKQLRGHLPIVFHDLLPENHEDAQNLVPNRGEILEFNKQVPLSRPLFDGFGGSVEDPAKPSAEAVEEVPAESSSPNQKSQVVVERLPNGWSKKAVKKLSGPTKGIWTMFLITPDQQVLRSAVDLKLYIAKSGAVIDSNLVNFSLPKKTAKADKKLNDLKSKKPAQSSVIEDESADVDVEMDVSNDASKEISSSTPLKISPKKAKTEGSGTKKNRNVIVLPKSSRREVKVPLKYRDEEVVDKTPIKVITMYPSNHDSTKKKAKKVTPISSPVEAKSQTAMEVASSPPELEASHPLDPEELKAAILQESSMVAVKSVPEPRRKSYQELSKLGVGTFRIDEDTAKGMVSGRFTKKIKIKRCGECKGCRTRNCRNCASCKDMRKYGGTGRLKQGCVNRRCSNPQDSDGATLFKKTVGKADDDLDLKSEDVESSNKTTITASNDSINDANDDDDDNPLNRRSQIDTPRIPIPPRSNDRPKLSYSGLIAMAIQNLPGQKATLQEIYDWIQEAFPYFSRIDKMGWQNSIRHNLSLHKAFYRTKDQAARKGGGIWRIDPKHSIGAFKKLKVSANKPKSVKLNDSFWEPDNDTYQDSPPEPLPKPVVIEPKKMVKIVASSPVKPLDDKEREARRQSIEEFIEMGMTNPGSSPRKPYVSYLESLEDVPMPPEQVAVKSKVIKVNTATLEKLETESSRVPYSGSTDYYKPYDPDDVAQVGQSVITTNDLAVEALCFLCGSAGEEDLLFCKSCCEPYHPFCLNPEELPLTSEAEINWLCRKCIQCQVIPFQRLRLLLRVFAIYPIPLWKIPYLKA